MQSHLSSTEDFLFSGLSPGAPEDIMPTSSTPRQLQSSGITKFLRTRALLAVLAGTFWLDGTCLSILKGNSRTVLSGQASQIPSEPKQTTRIWSISKAEHSSMRSCLAEACLMPSNISNVSSYCEKQEQELLFVQKICFAIHSFCTVT